MQLHEFFRCNYDCCAYYKLIKDSLYKYLLLYVDDVSITYKDKREIDKLKMLLNSEFDIRNLGYTKKILGIKIKRD